MLPINLALGFGVAFSLENLLTARLRRTSSRCKAPQR